MQRSGQGPSQSDASEGSDDRADRTGDSDAPTILEGPRGAPRSGDLDRRAPDRRALAVAREQYGRALAELPGEFTGDQREVLAVLALRLALGVTDPLRRSVDAGGEGSTAARDVAATLLDDGP